MTKLAGLVACWLCIDEAGIPGCGAGPIEPLAPGWDGHVDAQRVRNRRCALSLCETSLICCRGARVAQQAERAAASRVSAHRAKEGRDARLHLLLVLPDARLRGGGSDEGMRENQHDKTPGMLHTTH
eukprot:5903550-Prymnesium_polylepis.1